MLSNLFYFSPLPTYSRGTGTARRENDELASRSKSAASPPIRSAYSFSLFFADPLARAAFYLRGEPTLCTHRRHFPISYQAELPCPPSPTPPATFLLSLPLSPAMSLVFFISFPFTPSPSLVVAANSLQTLSKRRRRSAWRRNSKNAFSGPRCAMGKFHSALENC